MSTYRILRYRASRYLKFNLQVNLHVNLQVNLQVTLQVNLQVSPASSVRFKPKACRPIEEQEDDMKGYCAEVVKDSLASEPIVLKNMNHAQVRSMWFDRCGVVLVDLITYDLEPHLSDLVHMYRKFLGPSFYVSLSSLLVRPIFHGNISCLRYVLQYTTP